MLGAHLAAASVGYEDVAHVNRAYIRVFGVPPFRDVARLRHAARTRTRHEVASGQSLPSVFKQ